MPPSRGLDHLQLERFTLADNVSVIIVNWNGEDFLERCLNALLTQTIKPHEIILIDNASSDGSVKIAQQFPLVRILAQETNTGFARGNNLATALSSSESEWIALLNPDAFPMPQWLEYLLLAAKAKPEFAAFGSKLINASNPELLDGAGDSYHISGLVWRNAHGINTSTLDNIECEVFSPCAAAALYRRSIFEKVGGFDEDFFCYVEDIDLGFRLRLAGYRCLYVPCSVAYHIGSGTTGNQQSDFCIYHGHRNLIWAFVKNMPGVLFWLLLPIHLMLNLTSLILFSVRGQASVIFSAKRDALMGLPKMWHKRKQIQETRTASIWDIWRLIDKRLLPLRRKR